MLLKLHWEGPALWRNVWSRVQTIIPWGGQDYKPMLTVGKISVKAGETQERYAVTNKKPKALSTKQHFKVEYTVGR